MVDRSVIGDMVSWDRLNSRTGRLDEFAKLTAEPGMSDLFTSDRRNMSINEAEGKFCLWT